MAKGERPRIYGDGGQSRDSTNVAQANLLAATAPVDGSAVVNCACGTRTSLNDLFMQLDANLGTDLPADHVDARPGEVKHSLASVEVLGYEPEWTFADSLL